MQSKEEGEAIGMSGVIIHDQHHPPTHTSLPLPPLTCTPLLPPDLHPEGQRQLHRQRHQAPGQVHLHRALSQLPAGTVPTAVHGAVVHEEQCVGGAAGDAGHLLPL